VDYFCGHIGGRVNAVGGGAGIARGKCLGEGRTVVLCCG
jgi:hypothetical protein